MGEDWDIAIAATVCTVDYIDVWPNKFSTLWVKNCYKFRTVVLFWTLYSSYIHPESYGASSGDRQTLFLIFILLQFDEIFSSGGVSVDFDPLWLSAGPTSITRPRYITLGFSTSIDWLADLVLYCYRSAVYCCYNEARVITWWYLT